MAPDGRQASIVVMVMMVVATLVVDRPLLVVAAMTMHDDVVVVAVMVAVDMDVATAPLEVAPVILRRCGGRDEDQGRGEKGWDADSHGSFLKD
ncbi:hypothetical protein ASF18_13905 [Methylobacterium sp. Leaf89]|jgi:hypothetical protein|nr:hypothetical protein ASF18_13905 [Methylobacterium sp. Leaf89]